MELDAPVEVRFYLYLPTRDVAEEAGREVAQSGYIVDIRAPSFGYEGWLCLATRHMVPSADALDLTRVGFESLAARLGGEFDGWEAVLAAE
jgi:hypothetical protein